MNRQNFNVVSPDFKRGKNFRMGHFCFIGPGCEAGDEVSLRHHTVLHGGIFLGNESLIGTFCELESGVRIGKKCIIQGRVRIGRDTVIEDNVIVKYGTILAAGVKIGKGAFLGPNVIALGSTHKRQEITGITIGEDCYIGAGTQIAAGVRIGRGITTGAMTFVKNDLTEPGIYVGVPARRLKHSPNRSRDGEFEGLSALSTTFTDENLRV